MTTYVDVVKKCAICGKESEHQEIASTNTFGSSDLDLRPPEMERSTMDTWVEVCPHCGFVAGDISEETEVKPEMLKTKSYLTCDSIKFEGLAQAFYRQHLLAMATGNKKQAWNALLNAAWCCDDLEKKDLARICRLKIVPLLNAELEACTEKDRKDTLLVLRADILRRAGEFKKVIELYQNCKFDEEILNQIIQFQLKLAKKQDAGCYTVAMAVREKVD